MQICDWSGLDAECAHLIAGVTAGKPVARPFGFLAVLAPPATQTQCAKAFMEHDFPAAPPLWTEQNYRHDRIKLAYLSRTSGATRWRSCWLACSNDMIVRASETVR